MKCYYTYDKIAGKVLIPGCDGAASRGIENCTCRRSPDAEVRHQERQEVWVLRQEIRELEQENARMSRIIKKLLKVK